MEMQMEMQMEEKKMELDQACRILGVVPRDDSTLGTKFIQGELSSLWTAQQVAAEMCATQRLYKDTNYKQVLELSLRLIANEMHKRYPVVSWTTLWKYTKIYGADAVKYAAIRQNSSDMNYFDCGVIVDDAYSGRA